MLVIVDIGGLMFTGSGGQGNRSDVMYSVAGSKPHTREPSRSLLALPGDITATTMSGTRDGCQSNQRGAQIESVAVL